MTPGCLPLGPDVLHGADPQGPLEHREPVQPEEGEEGGEQAIPPPVQPYSMGNGNIYLRMSNTQSLYLDTQ